MMYKQILIALTILLSGGVAMAQNLGERTFNFKDRSRNNRPVVTEIWYPTVDTLKPSDKHFSPFLRQPTVRDGKLPVNKLPLILLSHGTGGGRLTLEWLAQALANSGCIVAAVDHYGNTYDHKIPLEFVKPWERPLDLSFALTSLLNNSDIGPLIDQQKIGAIGFSFGGYTVIALAGARLDFEQARNYYKTTGRKELEIPEFPGLVKLLDDSSLIAGSKHVPPLKDKRIKAFFSISPALGFGFIRKEQVADIKSPLYIVGSQSDSIAPVKTNARHYHQLISKSIYTELPGKIGHYVMLGEAIDAVKKEAPIYFTDDPSVNRHAIHLQVDSLAVGFFRKELK
ncbi:alpha/beta hydrolase family protein [Mucilaginibacter endophyticus]|uniref:alpha/beta hydrolase family protein n=1 Tax=Mucilaginibacter endophyticus TaxID=2675003 RepID=UPI000E0D10A1|nr:dienelactone hydrolase [Mucilaginibacter endophyticus]